MVRLQTTGRPRAHVRHMGRPAADLPNAIDERTPGNRHRLDQPSRLLFGRQSALR